MPLSLPHTNCYPGGNLPLGYGLQIPMLRSNQQNSGRNKVIAWISQNSFSNHGLKPSLKRLRQKEDFFFFLTHVPEKARFWYSKIQGPRWWHRESVFPFLGFASPVSLCFQEDLPIAMARGLQQLPADILLAQRRTRTGASLSSSS